jgi:hypothetical protein
MELLSNICAIHASQHRESQEVNAVNAKQMVASPLGKNTKARGRWCRSLSGKVYFVNDSGVGKALHLSSVIHLIFDKGTCIL